MNGTEMEGIVGLHIFACCYRAGRTQNPNGVHIWKHGVIKDFAQFTQGRVQCGAAVNAVKNIPVTFETENFLIGWGAD